MSHHSHHGFLAHLLRKPSGTRKIDLLAYVIGIVGNVAVVPQIIRSWSGPTPGMSIATWLMFSGFGVIWLVYAFVHKQKPLIVAQIVGLSCNLMVVIGWLIYS